MAIRMGHRGEWLGKRSLVGGHRVLAGAGAGARQVAPSWAASNPSRGSTFSSPRAEVHLSPSQSRPNLFAGD